MLPFLCPHFRFRGLRFRSSLKTFKFTIAAGVLHGLISGVSITFGAALRTYLDNDDRGVRFCIVPYWSVELASEQNSKQLILRLVPLPKTKQ